MVSSFSLASMYFLISSLISWLTHSFFNKMFFSLQVFVTFPNFFLVVDFEFHISLWSNNMRSMISIFLYLLRAYLCPSMWSILENVPCALEKNAYSAALEIGRASCRERVCLYV